MNTKKLLAALLVSALVAPSALMAISFDDLNKKSVDEIAKMDSKDLKDFSKADYEKLAKEKQEAFDKANDKFVPKKPEVSDDSYWGQDKFSGVTGYPKAYAKALMNNKVMTGLATATVLAAGYAAGAWDKLFGEDEGSDSDSEDVDAPAAA